MNKEQKEYREQFANISFLHCLEVFKVILKNKDRFLKELNLFDFYSNNLISEFLINLNRLICILMNVEDILKADFGKFTYENKNMIVITEHIFKSIAKLYKAIDKEDILEIKDIIEFEIIERIKELVVILCIIQKDLVIRYFEIPEVEKIKQQNVDMIFFYADSLNTIQKKDNPAIMQNLTNVTMNFQCVLEVLRIKLNKQLINELQEISKLIHICNLNKDLQNDLITFILSVNNSLSRIYEKKPEVQKLIMNELDNFTEEHSYVTKENTKKLFKNTGVEEKSYQGLFQC